MDDATVEKVLKVIESYLDQLDDPGDVDAQVLAENIVLNLERKP